MAGSTEISLLGFSEFADTVNRRFYEGGGLVKDLDALKSIYMVESIPNGTGDRRIYTEYDGQTYARLKGEGEDATKTAVVKGYNLTMTARRFAAEIDITAEARKFGKNNEILQKLTSLSTFIPQRMALDLTHRLSFATATSYTDMDGQTVSTVVGDTLALVSGSHTLNGSTTTYSNIITGNPAFSQGGFEAARVRANTQILSNFAERRVMDFNTVVTTDDPATIREVRQLLNSTADVDGAHSGIQNTYSGQFKHVVLPQLATTAAGAYDSTKAKYWFYIAAGEWEAHLGIWEESNLKMPGPANNGEDVHNDNWTFGARGTYGIATVSPKGCLHSTGLGS
jgi:hypothetical protein|tara:strand:+ start:8739 stop:9755 length:1017 start_codon:yes stop_codon:yes gene_type:complete